MIILKEIAASTVPARVTVSFEDCHHGGSEMNRRAALGGLALATGLVATARERFALAAFASGGYGMTVKAFQAAHGEGQAGQSYLQYPQSDGMLFVGQNNGTGLVDFIERLWNPETHGTENAAITEAMALLPDDALLSETFTAQFGYIGYGQRIDRYRSSHLKAQFGSDAISSNAIFVVVYEFVPATASLASEVLRFSILAAEAPSS
jgi:hypothetical protein